MNQSLHVSTFPMRRPPRLPAASVLSRAVRGALALSAVAGIALAPSAFAANFTVTSTADTSASGTLRWAIDQANNTQGADTITFAANVSGTITLSNDTLYISDALTITGPGAGILTVDGGNVVASSVTTQVAGTPIDGSVFRIRPGYTQTPEACSGNCPQAVAVNATPVTISGLTISGGSATAGGGIYALNTNLSVQQCTITGNQTSGRGGGIYATVDSNTPLTGAAVNITGSTISGNDGHYAGGGIYAHYVGNVTVDTSTIANNTAKYEGGGIYVDRSEALTITASTISGNGVGGSEDGNAARGGGIYVSHTQLAISNSTIYGNQAVNGNSDASGGGIYIRASDSTGATLINATITHNRADDGGGLFARADAYEYSGAVTNATSDTALDITNTVIANNVGANGPAVYSYGSSGPGATFNLSHSFLQSQITGNANVNDDGTNQFASDPGLGPLASNGGPTMRPSCPHRPVT